jgi:ribosome maturation factor RimP
MMTEDLKKNIETLAECHEIWVEEIRVSDDSGGTIRVLCDKEGGIECADLQQFSKEIQKSEWFDQNFSERFDLEVSSPGLDFPLTLPRHFRKNLGQIIKVRHTLEGIPSPVFAKIQEVTESDVILQKENASSGADIKMPLSAITVAKIKLKW